jgi:pyridoxamine 5'-phosphate oxidase
MSIDIGSMRQQYANTVLDIDSLGNDPINAFSLWFQHAIDAQIKEPNAMMIATVDNDGMPDARVVLLKEVDAKGFVFYTNYSSAKGQQLQDNPHACLVFSWLDLERQVRIRGSVSKYDESKSEAYFQTRPRQSQIAAWSSPQSKPIADRAVLESLVHETTLTFTGVDLLPKPPVWGGYILSPVEIEFWQGRRDRLHDRIKYMATTDGWKATRLAP